MNIYLFTRHQLISPVNPDHYFGQEGDGKSEHSHFKKLNKSGWEGAYLI